MLRLVQLGQVSSNIGMFFRGLIFKRVLILSFLALTFSVIIRAKAQQNDPCGCNAALIEGVYRSRVERGDDEARNDVARSILNTRYDEFRSRMSTGGGLSFQGFGFNANMSEDEFQKRKTELRDNFSISGGSRSNRYLLERYGDTVVLEHWSSCKSSCDTRGMHSWIEIRDANYMVLHIKWIPMLNVEPRVIGSNIQGAQVLSSNVQNGEVFSVDHIIPIGESSRPIYRDDPDRSVNIYIEIPGMDISEFIPAYIESLDSDKETLLFESARVRCINGDSEACLKYVEELTLECGSPTAIFNQQDLIKRQSCLRRAHCWRNRAFMLMSLQQACSQYGESSIQCLDAKRLASRNPATLCDEL